MAAPPKPTTEVDLSGFGLERVQHIGRGQYASAQLVRETATGATYVAKCISLAALNEHDQDLAHQEVFLLQTLCHPYIVAYRDSFLIEGANTLVIVMEYCDGGDLRKAIKEKAKAGEYFPEEQVMTWFVQLCLSLQYIHAEKVLHRDLKTSNIFLTEGSSSVIKLGDFGISRVFEGTTEAAVTIVGTPYYMSPEVCRSEPYNWKSDVWALGCVLYELCMLKHAFESSSLLGLVYKIVSDHYEPIPAHYSPELNDLIRKLLMKSAESRPSINEIFAIPYVKAYLAKETVKIPAPIAADVASPSKKAPSFRPRDKPAPAPPAPPAQPQVPGPAPLEPAQTMLVVAARVRRRLVGQKLNWISAFAAFDEAGDGELSPETLGNALMSMHLGLSQEEINLLAGSLQLNASGKISLDTFSFQLMSASPEVQQYETWARQILAPCGRRLRDLLTARDMEQRGTLAPGDFQAALHELVPMVTAQQLDLLSLLADKNGLGDVDYAEFCNTFAAPLAPPTPAAPRPVAPPGMPPLPGAPTATPPGMPPLPGAKSTPAAAPVDPLMTLNMADITLDRSFFSCISLQLAGTSHSVAGGRRSEKTLSPQGCALVFARIRRRLEAAGLAFSDTLALFTNPGERELTAEQWLDAASTMPLGTSRAEMQQLFSKADAAGSGRVSLSTLESLIARVSAADCGVAPAWISGAMQRGLCGRVQDELRKLGGPVPGSTLARESDFRRVVMQTERYLTADQLNSLVLLVDKSAEGHVDYEEFAQRFGGGGAGLALRAPGGALPLLEAPPTSPTAPPTPDELRVVGARTGAVLERQGLAPECLPALISLWGGELPLDVVAMLLAMLPLGLSLYEALAQLQATGNVAALAAQLSRWRGEGVWTAQCQWAAANIPGPALRSVLQKEVIDVESRSLEQADFARALALAGVAQGNAQVVMWLAEKTTQGDIRAAEFLDKFGDQATEATKKKKKRGMFARILGR